MKKEFIDPILKVVKITNDIIATSDPNKEETGVDITTPVDPGIDPD